MPGAGTTTRVAGWVRSWFPSVVDDAVAAATDAGWRVDRTSDYCPRCGATVAEEAVTPEGCPFCRDAPIHWHRFVRLGGYGEPLADWVRALKFHRQWFWGPWLGRQLAAALDPPAPAPGSSARAGEGSGSDAPDHRPLVTAVPLHWRRHALRGYNQSWLIARAVAEARRWPAVPLLRRIRHTRPQTALSPSDRIANVRGCFAAHPIDLAGRDVILIDDVKTTGATLSACTRLLRTRGARSIVAATAAVADPRGQQFQSL